MFRSFSFVVALHISITLCVTVGRAIRQLGTIYIHYTMCYRGQGYPSARDYMYSLNYVLPWAGLSVS